MIKIKKFRDSGFVYSTQEEELNYRDFVFPGGEIGVKLNTRDHSYKEFKVPHQTIIARLQDSAEVIKLAMIKDALERFDETPINLLMPYIPYGRQDRVCDKGESFSLKVFANYINSLKFDKVTICDPHSEVSTALFDRVRVISQLDIINKWIDFTSRGRKCVLISPDAGAGKKTAEIAKYFQHSEFVRADKLRDLTNGNIKETIVYCDDFKGRDVLCVDDICDGGRTFLELAKVCKAKNCGKFVLYVTHGIFSKGVLELFNNGVDEIWTTDSFKTLNVQDGDGFLKERFFQLELEEKFKYLI
jgi:ribose-phosphate pyrophosphokinase